jgi:thymidylate kinase
MKTHSPLLISFSGLDGAGKTTQIDNLRATLAASGLTSRVLAFWDDVVVLSRYREGFVHKVYGSERGIGAPGKPVNRRDKNVRRWYLTLSRHGLYFLDALHLRIVAMRALRSTTDVVIFDRYLYDELANLPLHNPASRAFARLMNRLIPRPDLAFVLDADPEAAVARKPEYPVDFMRKCRQAYYALASLLGTLTIVPPLPLAEAKNRVVQHAFAALGRSDVAQATADPAPAA